MKKLMLLALALFFMGATSNLVLAEETAAAATPAPKAMKAKVKKMKKAPKKPAAAAPAVTPAAK